MTKSLFAWIAAVLMGAALGQAHAASIDFGRIFDIGKDVVTATSGLSEEDEIAVGREVAGRTLGAAPLVPDPELQAYVNRVGRWVAVQTERPDLPWHFGVVDSPAINAFAAPGGYVLVTRGLYEILDNEAQLAGVLGHEIGHIVRRHHITVMQQSAAVSAGAKIAQGGDQSYLVNNLIGTGAEVLARGLDKNAEFEADRIGVILAARAGYDPYAFADVLQKLAVRGQDDQALVLLFKTHPAPGERLTHLGDALTPRLTQLPAGASPAIRRGSAAALTPAAAKPASADGTGTLQQGAPAAPAESNQDSGGGGVDPGSLLQGIFGR